MPRWISRLFPGHEPKFVAISNLLASVITQVRNLLPEYFHQYDFDRTTLARKTIDDLYVDSTEAGVDDPAFMAQVEQFIASLPPLAAAEMFAYRHECQARNAARRRVTEPEVLTNRVARFPS